jgi:hypothetical protein
MSEATVAEQKALEESGALPRFAAEHVKDLDSSISLVIAKAVDASHTNKWTPEISQEFWGAFGHLCDLIKPVTMDGLAVSHSGAERRNWTRLWREGVRSTLAERTSRRYMILLFILISCSLPLQLYIWSVTSVGNQIDDLMKELTAQFAQLSSNCAQLISSQTTRAEASRTPPVEGTQASGGTTLS